eukprot:jgi/Tetstr1/426793/TSEL_017008.t1
MAPGSTASDDDRATEFAGRDASGLLPDDKAKPEAKARAFYFKLVARGCGSLRSSPGHDLGYIYLAWFLVLVARSYATVNANEARAPARLDRPDQHIYKIMAESGPLAGAPYVLMATTGEAGRLNRAQRACANMDEGMPLFLSGLLLQGAVFGPLAACVAALYMYGAVRFATDYKADPKARLHGFMCSGIAQMVSGGFVSLIAVRTLLLPLLPFGL